MTGEMKHSLTGSMKKQLQRPELGAYPSMEHRTHIVHMASPAALWVSVRTTSSQDGHVVTPASRSRLSTFTQRKKGRKKDSTGF